MGNGNSSNFNFPGWAIGLIAGVAVILILVLLAFLISRATHKGFMTTLANVFWAVLIGWEAMIIYFIEGLICCVTIIFIPVGLQFFKLARLAIWPFGYKPVFTKVNGFKMVINIIWLILAGWENAVSCFVLGGLCCATVILIPCGLQLYKFGRLVLLPLGTTIERA